MKNFTKQSIMLLIMLSLSGCTGYHSAEPERESTEGTEVTQATEANSYVADDDQEAFLEFLDTVNEKNALLDAPSTNLDQYKYDYLGGEPLFTAEDDSLGVDLDQVTELPQTISREDAKKEVDWYFRLLRTFYGLYTFYGGDEAFGAARMKCLEQLDAGSELLSIEEEYAPMLRDSLSFARDNHWMIGNVQMCPEILLMGNPDATFSLKNGVFYGGEDGDRAVESIENEPPENYLKPAIDKEGRLAYCPYIQVPEDERIETIVVRYQGGGEEEIPLEEETANSKTGKRKEILCTYEQDGIYTVQMNRMVRGSSADGPYQEGDDVIRERFLETAKNLQEASVGVFDLRYNGGGNGLLADEWFRIYTGEPLQPNYSSLTLRLRMGEDENSLDVLEQDARYRERGWDVDGSYYVKYPTPQFVDKKGSFLIVRTSDLTCSAAEVFTDMSRNLKNTLRIGTPTGGCITGDQSYFGVEMPWSKLSFTLGTKLYYWDEDYFSEGWGFVPDLYLTGSYVESRLDLFIERYLLP